MDWNIFNIFKKKEENTNTAANLFADDNKLTEFRFCDYCDSQGKCKKDENPSVECIWVSKFNYDKNKPSILIVDDNPGMVSFLKDDITFLGTEGLLDLNEFNILTFDSPLAAFNFQRGQDINNGFNIKYAILDITLGGSIMTKDGNLKYTGVDIYEMILKYNPDVNVLFYTGNQLNPYIKSNKKLIDQFEFLSDGKNIKDYTLFKTSLDLDSRREFFIKFLNEDIKK